MTLNPSPQKGGRVLVGVCGSGMGNGVQSVQVWAVERWGRVSVLCGSATGYGVKGVLCSEIGHGVHKVWLSDTVWSASVGLSDRGLGAGSAARAREQPPLCVP
eukprot:3937860-Rhodomonas_salina.1